MIRSALHSMRRQISLILASDGFRIHAPINISCLTALGYNPRHLCMYMNNKMIIMFFNADCIKVRRLPCSCFQTLFALQPGHCFYLQTLVSRTRERTRTRPAHDRWSPQTNIMTKNMYCGSIRANNVGMCILFYVLLFLECCVIFTHTDRVHDHRHFGADTHNISMYMSQLTRERSVT